jgi:rubrerythrin
VPRGERRSGGASLCLAAAAIAAALAICGCGSSDSSSSVEAEKESDAEIVNVGIGQELTLIEAFEGGEALLRRPQARRTIRLFKAQEQEHLNGLTKTIRGLGATVDAEASEVDLAEVKDERDFLLLAYELTGSALTGFLEAVPHLATARPRALIASIAANEAQHQVALRQLLGADLPESVPEGFDTGEVPPPGER